MRPSFIVGLTGGIGSGKSEVSRRFALLGVDIVDADIAARDVAEPGQPALEKIALHFGVHLISNDGRLDRATLRNIIFSNPDEKKWLEQLLHPIINLHIRQSLARSNSPYSILTSPLLLETRQYELVNRILVVDAGEDIQLARAQQRDASDEAQIKAIMAAQLPRQARRARADDIILNEGPLAALDDQVEALHTRYLDIARQSG